MFTDAFPLVLAGHLLGDFVSQTDWEAANKEVDWWPCIRHTITYNLTLAVLLLPAWGTWIAPFLLISFASHALLDRRWPTRLIMRLTGSPGFSKLLWGVIATDQALHISILAVSYYFLAPR